MSLLDFWNYQSVSFSLGKADALLSSSNGKLEIQPLNGGMNPTNPPVGCCEMCVLKINHQKQTFWGLKVDTFGGDCRILGWYGAVT